MTSFCSLALLASLLIILKITLIQGAVVKHIFEVSYFSGSPDGVFKDNILGINGQFPGPKIEGFVGDTLEVTVLNKIQDKQNLTIHWHGMHQRGSLFEDGTSQIAQCPLPYGSFQVYRFNLTQPGTFWYHSHVNSQYTEGLLGALIVHDHPDEEAYPADGEITLILTDWYHRPAEENEKWYLSPDSRGGTPYPDSSLINGLGRYPCYFAQLQNRSCSNIDQYRPVFKIQDNSTYRIRIINAGALAFFNFSIDGHILDTIEVDGQEVAKPVPVHIVPIAPGQRYSFLVRPPPPPAGRGIEQNRFLIRSVVAKQLLYLREGENINKYPQALLSEVTAVLSRIDEDLSHFRHLVEESMEQFTHEEILPPPLYNHYNMNAKDGQPIVLNEMDLSPLDGIPAPNYFDEEHILLSTTVTDQHNVTRQCFNRTPLALPHDKPFLFTLLDKEGNGKLPPGAVPLEVEENSVVQLVINNAFGTHPFHLHGHHFWVVGIGQPQDGNYDPIRHNLTLTGVKRDTVVANPESYVVIRFIADNPGIWTFHCHMDWHNLAGMGVTIVEAPDLLRREEKVTDEAMRICQLHK